MKKKDKQIMWIIIAVVALFLIGGFADVKTFAVLTPSSIINSQESLVRQTNTDALYSFDVSVSYNGGCGAHPEQDFDFIVNTASNQGRETELILAEDLKLNTEFPAENIVLKDLKALENPCGSVSIQRIRDVKIDNIQGLCKIEQSGVTNNLPRGLLTCRISGNLHAVDENGNPTFSPGQAESTSFSYSGVSLDVRIPKEGTGNGGNGNGGVCAQVITPYYIIENNQCVLKQNPTSCLPDGSYKTKTECVNVLETEPPIAPPITSNLGIFLILGGIGGLLFWLFRRNNGGK